MRQKPKPFLLSLSSNTALMTATNDIDYSKVLVINQQIGKKGDILITIGSSGKSKNIIDAIKMQKKKLIP